MLSAEMFHNHNVLAKQHVLLVLGSGFRWAIKRTSVYMAASTPTHFEAGR